MTDTTGIAALREFLMEQIDHVDSYGGKVWLCTEDARLAMSSLDQLEAQRQRADEFEKKFRDELGHRLIQEVKSEALDEANMRAHKAEASVGVLEGIIARKEFDSLKGEQVPVGEIVAWNHPNEERKVDFRFLRFDVQPGTQLFTAPQKLVVRPRLDPCLKQWQFERDCEWKAAIEAAGGIVKDGE